MGSAKHDAWKDQRGNYDTGSVEEEAKNGAGM
jgi:hypothetical protein